MHISTLQVHKVHGTTMLHVQKSWYYHGTFPKHRCISEISKCIFLTRLTHISLQQTLRMNGDLLPNFSAHCWRPLSYTHTHTKERLFYEEEQEVTLDYSVCCVWSLTSFPFPLNSELVQRALSFHCSAELCAGLWEKNIYGNKFN